MKIKLHLSGNLALLAASLILTSTSLHAVNYTWVGGSGTWNDSTTTNWSPASIPSAAIDEVLFQTAGITVNYTATPISAPGFAKFDFLSTGALSTFNLDASDILRVNDFFRIGQFIAGAVQFNLSGSAQLIVDGGGATQIGGSSSNAVFNQTGGTFNNGVTGGQALTVATNGTYNLSGGTLNGNRALTVNSGGSYVQTGGDGLFQTTGTTTINGNWSLSGGSFQTRDFVLGANASASWTGGNLTMSDSSKGSIQLQGNGASWTQGGGTITVNSQGNSSNALVVSQSSIFQGYGAVNNVNANGRLVNSGRVIANGGGTDRTLTLSGFGSVVNTNDNTSNNGWYATNKGKLILPTLSVAASSSVNWGESTNDTTIDMVNSLRMTTTAGVTTGNISISLLAPDRTDITAPMASLSTLSKGATVLGLWDFDLTTFAFNTGSMTVTARYDNAAYDAFKTKWGTGTLDMYLYNGTQWSSVYSSADLTSAWVTSSAITSFGSGANSGLLAVSVIPEPSTWALFVSALATVTIFRRRRAS